MQASESFRADMRTEFDRVDNKRRELELKMIEMEEASIKQQEQAAQKDAEIAKLRKKLQQQESSAETYDAGVQKVKLEDLASLEAELQFAKNEKKEVEQQMEYMRQVKNEQIEELKDKLGEFTDKYNEARQSQAAVDVYRKKMQQFDDLIPKLQKLERQNVELRQENQELVSYRTKLKECEQALQHFKTDVYSSMKTQHDTQLKLEKLTGQL